MHKALLLFSIAFFVSCQNPPENIPLAVGPLDGNLLPSDAAALQAIVYQDNCWIEKDRFFVVGICSNTAPDWKKIWLDAVVSDAQGKPLTISRHASAIVNTWSDAVPPSGRTSFFASWPLSDISGKPASCRLTALAVSKTAGPVLAIPLVNGMKILAPGAAGQPATEQQAWQVSGSILNALPVVAEKPRLEVLVYGSDNKLWLSTLLNPEDPAVQAFFQIDATGPMKAGEERGFSLQVFTQGLPETLKAKGIGRVDLLPFVAR